MKNFVVSALVAAGSLLVVTQSFAQVVCTQMGHMTTCSDGSSATRLGDRTFYNDGSSSMRLGNHTTYSPGFSRPQGQQPQQQQPQLFGNDPFEDDDDDD